MIARAHHIYENHNIAAATATAANRNINNKIELNVRQKKSTTRFHSKTKTHRNKWQVKTP